MASFNKILDYVEQVNQAVHNWASHTFKVAMSNTAIVNTNHNLGAITQIAASGGYTDGAGGGYALDSVTLSEAAGTAKVVIADEVVTASGGTIGAVRYHYFYNDSAASPADAGICWYDYGSSISILDTETFTYDFDATNGLWQMA